MSGRQDTGRGTISITCPQAEQRVSVLPAVSCLVLLNDGMTPPTNTSCRRPQSVLSRGLQHRSLLVRLVTVGTLGRMLRVLAPLLKDLDAALAMVGISLSPPSSHC